jgi:hypothetical protein
MVVMWCSKWTRCAVKSAMQPSTAALIVSGNMHSFTRELANAPSSSPNLLQKLQESQVDNMQFYSHATQTLLSAKFGVVKFLFPCQSVKCLTTFCQGSACSLSCVHVLHAAVVINLQQSHVDIELSRAWAFFIVC